ncbi:MAG: hypothetical protein ACTJHU_09350 [Mycetocola sp.]
MSTPTAPVGTDEPVRRSRRALIGVAALLAVVALAAGAVVGTVFAQQGAAPAPAPTSSESASPVAERPVPTAAGDAQPLVSVPTDCSALYSPGMLEFLNSTGLPLNDESVKDVVGTDDPQLQELIRSHTTLHCAWGGAGEYGLSTNVTVVTSDVQERVLARLGELGFECGDDGNGTRCVLNEVWDQASGGETHVLRDGLWIATDWVNFGPSNYTSDIVNTLFGE